MERHEILSVKIDWPNLVRHVVRDRVVVELAEGERPVAMLVPIERPGTLADLDAALRKLPRLGEDATSFEAAKLVDSKSYSYSKAVAAIQFRVDHGSSSSFIEARACNGISE
jgi:antitoxin (DNA-binding transcriptional repressor) of toxin-antitoxin stability system